MVTRRECPRCGATGVLIRPERDHAVARLCDCRSPCPDCGGMGHFFRADERGYEVAVACECQRVEKRARLFNQARLPARYHAATLEGFEVSDPGKSASRAGAYRFARAFAPGERGLLYYGPCGTGKTHLLVAILRHLVLHRGIQVRFVEFMHLLSDLRATFGDPGGAEEVMAPLVDVPVLAVDELGKGRGSEWELQVLDELISKRYNAGRTTLFTSNFYPHPDTDDAQSLSDRVGERIYSRLMEMCHLQHMGGEDFRRRSART
jgi:DNA replication protein DnaC